MRFKTIIFSSIFIMTLLMAANLVYAEPQSIIEVTVPDFSVIKSGNYDIISFEDSQTLTEEEGRPSVPYMIKTIDYPAGYKIQDVVLSDRSGLVSDNSGLNLKPVMGNPNKSTLPTMIPGWYPLKDFDFKVWENEDESSTLVIKIYPFYYEPASKEVKFYKNYSFEIISVKSDISITDFELEKLTVKSDEALSANIEIANEGSDADVSLSVFVKQNYTGKVVGGIPMRALKGLFGKAEFNEVIETSDISPGNYYLEANISDLTGNILDSKSVEFSIENTALNKFSTFMIGKKNFHMAGLSYPMDVEPYIKNDRTFLPVRYVAYACGLMDENITYDNSTSTVTLTKNNITIKLKIGETFLTVNDGTSDKKVELDVVPEIKDGRTMLPVRWVAQEFGYSVDWDDALKLISLKEK